MSYPAAFITSIAGFRPWFADPQGPWITTEALTVTKKSMFTVNTLSLEALKDPKIEKAKEEKGGRGNTFFFCFIALLLLPNLLSTSQNMERYILASPWRIPILLPFLIKKK